MMLVVSKVIYFFIHPYTWMLLAILTWFFVKNKKLKKIGKICTLVIALFFSNTFIFKEFTRLWQVYPIPVSDVSYHDVGIVLGGMFYFDNSVQRLSTLKSVDRIWQAMELYHHKKIGKICVVGRDGTVVDRGLYEAVQVKEQLVGWGIPAEDIIIETKSRNTYENAKFTAALLKDSLPKYESFLLITSASHMKRAQACFRKQEMSVDVFPVNGIVGKKRHYHWDEFIVPDVSNFYGWFLYLKEIVGYVGYRIFGLAK